MHAVLPSAGDVDEADVLTRGCMTSSGPPPEEDGVSHAGLHEKQWAPEEDGVSHAEAQCPVTLPYAVHM